MARKISGELSAASIARADRQRIAAEEGRQAMAEIERQANAVRENMARLRALREAEEMRTRDVRDEDTAAPRARKKRSKAGAK